MGEESTVSMRVVRAIVEAVRKSGVQQSQVAASLGLDGDSLTDLDRRVERADIYPVLEAVLDATDDPAFGLHWAERLPDNALSPISHLAFQAPCLSDALEQLRRFHWLLTDETNFRMHEQGGLVFVQLLKLTGASPRVQRVVTETVITGLTNLIRHFNRDAHIEIKLDYPAPAYADEYVRVLGSLVRFDQASPVMIFDAALLTAKSPFGDAEFHNSIRAFTEQRIGQLTQKTSYATRVRAILTQGPPRKATMQTVARTMGICDRTLRRRLTAEGTSYDQVASEAAMTVAKAWLLDPERTIKAVALELGFSDRRAFHRAFRRWTGMTPAQFRKSGLASRVPVSPDNVSLGATSGSSAPANESPDDEQPHGPGSPTGLVGAEAGY